MLVKAVKWVKKQELGDGTQTGNSLTVCMKH